MNQFNNSKQESSLFDSDPKNLNWLAFCYIADELDQAEREEFEARLAECEITREAVVVAMRDSQILYKTLEQDSQPVASGVTLAVKEPSLGLRWMATLVASAAAVLLAVNSWYFIFPTNGPIVTVESDGLAAAWVETLITMSNEELDEFINEEVPQTEVVTDGSDDWMFVALAEADSSESIDGEAH